MGKGALGALPTFLPCFCGGGHASLCPPYALPQRENRATSSTCGGVTELVDRGDAFDAKAAVDQRLGVAREGRDVAGTPRPRPQSCSPRADAPGPVRPAAAGRTRPCRSRAIQSASAGGGTGRGVSALIGFRPDVRCHRLLQRGDRTGVAVERRDFCFRGEPQRERPDAAEQIGDMFGAPAMSRRPGLRALPRRRASPAGTSPAAE